MIRRFTRKRGGAKVSFSQAGIAAQLGIDPHQLQSRLNRAARRGKKHSVRRALLTRMTSTRGISLRRAKALGFDPKKIQTVKRESKPPTRYTDAGSTRQATSSTRRATTAANEGMKVPPDPAIYTYYIQQVGLKGNQIVAAINHPTATDSNQHKGLTERLEKMINEMEGDLNKAAKGYGAGTDEYRQNQYYRKQIQNLRAAVKNLAAIREKGHAAAYQAGKHLVDADLANVFAKMSTSG